MSEQLPRPERVILVGSVFVDLVMRVDELPRRGDDVTARQATAVPGGGFPLLAAARRHGLPAAFAGQHGAGPFGAAVRSACQTHGVEPLLPQTSAGDTGFRALLVEPTGDDQVSVTTPGVDAVLDAAALASVTVSASEAVYVSGRDLAYNGTGQAIAAWTRRLPRGSVLVYDPGPWVDEIPWQVQERVLGRADVVATSVATIKRLVGTGRPGPAVRALREYAPCMRMCVARRGRDGCWVAAPLDEPPLEVTAPPVDVWSEPEGFHTGVLLAGLSRGLGAERAALRATVATALHATSGYPDAEAVDRYLGGSPGR